MVHDLPGVGANLQDHYVARVSHRAKNAVSINQLAHGVRLAAEAVRFVATGRGALTFGVTSAQVFCRSRRNLASPICNFCSRRPATTRRASANWSASRA